MGKVSCVACNKRCKGQAIKLEADKYFHARCFTCKECGKQLSAREFYTRDGLNYCSDDYKRLFTTVCRSCSQAVDGSVITVLDYNFHPECFSCSRCRTKLAAGDKVTYNGTEFVCAQCRDQPASVVTPPLRPHLIEQLNSPDSDFSVSMHDYVTDDQSLLSPVSGTSGYKSSDVSDERADSRGFLSPNTHFIQYRSTSPVSNASSRKSRESGGSGGFGRATPDYGRFYKTTYMDLTDGYKRGPSINVDVSVKPVQHFHRPDGFSYRSIRTDIWRPAKKVMSHFIISIKSSGHIERYKPVKTQEPIQLAKLPDAQPLDRSNISPIERDDWPAPPAPAAAYPELLREGRLHRHQVTAAVDTSEKENERPHSAADVKIEKEIQELSKLQESSGAAKVILKDLQKKKLESPKLDPRSASRTPNASLEPPCRTRYESPIYASPSRDLDMRLQLPSLDQSFTEIKYRTPSPANFLLPRPGYGLRSYTIDSRNGFLSDVFDGYYCRRPGSSAAVLERTSYYSSQSDIEEFDPTTGLRRNSRLRSTAMSDGRRTPFSTTAVRRRSASNVLSDDEPTKTYTYNELRLSNNVLPAGVDKNKLEEYLSKEEFFGLFNMPMEEFYRLAEWKRNDMKKRLDLF